MISFKTTLQKFEEKGDKTHWTFIRIPAHIAQQINPNVRISYRVKGKFDDFPINQVALLPMGEGDFIIPFNNKFRKGTGKKKEGTSIEVSLEIDTSEFRMSEDLMACLDDEPNALIFFETLPKAHQKYFSNWIESAKTIETKSKRISQTVIACSRSMGYGEMVRYFRDREV
jgi:Domain of unknown function (DUF1905)/Bacteriocin-protection, YdeI or OmpD-Associated